MIILIALLLLFSGSGVRLQACDVCSGGLGGNVMNVLPQFNRHMVGVRYRLATGSAIHPGSDTSPRMQDVFHQLELWARYMPHSRVQLMASLPFSVNTQVENGNQSLVYGLSDVMLQAQVVLFQSAWSPVTSTVRHLLLAGVGLKCPTGSYQLRQKYQTVHPNRQPGSGSWDVPFQLMYSFRKGSLGFQADGVYQLNTPNPLFRKSGDRVNASLKAFYLWQKQKWMIMPVTGFSFEWHQMDKLRGYDVEFTGGHAFFAQAGLDLFYSIFNVGLRADYPVYQRYGGGYAHNGIRLSTQVLFLFSSIKSKKQPKS